MSQTSTFDLAMTVNEAIARHPRTVAVFNQFGIDACCGGATTIPEAARRDGADPDALVDAVRRIVDEDLA